MPIWTTTAWTLPANQAVALGPEIAYVLVEAEINGNGELLVLAEALAEEALTRYAATSSQVLAQFNGAVLRGLELQHPFLDRRVNVINTDFVTVETGTGAVHIAPGHGHDDFAAGLDELQLPVLQLWGEDDPFGTAYLESTKRTLTGADLETVIIEDCGHYWHECPEPFFEHVRAFLKTAAAQ